MVEPSPSRPFLALNAAMRQDYREAVVRDALHHYKQASHAARQRLEKAIQDHVKVKGGFRDPLRAPMTALLQEVVATSYRSNTVLGAVLHVWIESHADLRALAYNFLRAKGMLATEAADLGEGFTGSWTLPEMFQAAATFQAQYSNFDRDDVALMLCCLTGLAPLPTEEEPPKKEGSAMKWRQWLDELRTLPADAPEWETVTEFVEAVQQLREEKRQEREASRERLRLTLATLLDQAAADLDYFNISNVTSWTAEVCPLTEAVALAKQVVQLHEALVKHPTTSFDTPSCTRA